MLLLAVFFRGQKYNSSCELLLFRDRDIALRSCTRLLILIALNPCFLCEHCLTWACRKTVRCSWGEGAHQNSENGKS